MPLILLYVLWQDFAGLKHAYHWLKDSRLYVCSKRSANNEEQDYHRVTCCDCSHDSNDHRYITVPHLNGEVTIDGRLDEPKWAKAVHIPYTAFTRWVDNTYSYDPTIFKMSFFHNGKTFYVSLVSHDRYVESDAAPENSDGRYSLSFLTRSGKLKHYRLRWAANKAVSGGDMRDSGKWSAHLLGPFDKSKRRGGGYVFEFAIPLSAINHKPGDTVPLNIIVNDRDGKPCVHYHTKGAEFARFAWGSFDNDNRIGYKALRLES